jgi:transcriptional regulator with XRE-family HTH domain
MVVVTEGSIAMSLTSTQARRLGALIAKTRAQRGIAQTALATQLDVAAGWLAGLEQGRFLDPSNERLARIAEVLDIEPKRIERITRGRVAHSLPGMRTYFRAKYDMTPEQIERIERYVRRLQRGPS